MRLKSTFRLVLLLVPVFVLLGTGLQLGAQTTSETYVILGTGQGKGSTAFVANLGPALVANYEEIGVVVAQSSDPNFASWAGSQHGVQSVTEDLPVQWVSPNEKHVALDDASVNALALPPANAETFSAVQWNLHQIHADQTAANGDRGNGVARARVAVLDSGIIIDHIDIAANLNLGLSKSFVPAEPNVDAPHDGSFSHGTHVSAIIAAPIQWHWRSRRCSRRRAGDGEGALLRRFRSVQLDHQRN